MASRATGMTAAEQLLPPLPEVAALSNIRPTSSMKDVDNYRPSREDTQDDSWFPKKPKVNFVDEFEQRMDNKYVSLMKSFEKRLEASIDERLGNFTEKFDKVLALAESNVLDRNQDSHESNRRRDSQESRRNQDPRNYDHNRGRNEWKDRNRYRNDPQGQRRTDSRDSHRSESPYERDRRNPKDRRDQKVMSTRASRPTTSRRDCSSLTTTTRSTICSPWTSLSTTDFFTTELLECHWSPGIICQPTKWNLSININKCSDTSQISTWGTTSSNDQSLLSPERETNAASNGSDLNSKNCSRLDPVLQQHRSQQLSEGNLYGRPTEMP